MRYRPVSNRILVRRDEAQETTKGGIVLPDQAREKPLRGTVLAVGPGRLLDSGERRLAVDLTAGDVILFGRYHGEEVPDPDGGADKLLLVRDEEVMAVVET